jgi:hypothetical protein
MFAVSSGENGQYRGTAFSSNQTGGSAMRERMSL